MSQDWKHNTVIPPKPDDFPIIGKLPTDDRPPERCHYFVINIHKGLRQHVGRGEYLWKSIENL